MVSHETASVAHSQGSYELVAEIEIEKQQRPHSSFDSIKMTITKLPLDEKRSTEFKGRLQNLAGITISSGEHPFGNT